MADFEVLLIEDNSSDAELACITLDELNLTDRTLIINNGEDALTYLKEVEEKLSQNFDVKLRMVFMDIMLPKFNGFEILEQLNVELIKRDVTIVVFSSSDIPKDIRKAYDLGVNGFLVKPIDFNKHQHVIKSAINFWLN
jgi:CheY-like chemotaxis protein